MGLIDWLRGGRPETPDAQEERVGTMKDPGADVTPEPAHAVDEQALAEHDEEAARHRGM
jgi:hypothetical protein